MITKIDGREISSYSVNNMVNSVLVTVNFEKTFFQYLFGLDAHYIIYCYNKSSRLWFHYNSSVRVPSEKVVPAMREILEWTRSNGYTSTYPQS